MSDVRELMKEAELVMIRPLGLSAKLGAGPAPGARAAFENQFDVKTGFVRTGETGFTVMFLVDCKSKRTSTERPFARFTYHVAIQYQAKRHWADEFIVQFAQTNAAVHAWPYARQFIHSSSTQLGLSPVLLPALRVGQPKPGTKSVTFTPEKAES